MRRPRGLRQLGVALAGRPALGDLPGHAVLVDDEEVVAGAGDRGETEHHAPDATGPASSTVSPFSSSMARTRPNASPATIESPTRSVPRWTSTVATGPRPRSRWASIGDTLRVLVRVGPQVERGVRGEQDRLEQLVDVRGPRLAETSTNIVSPPYSSATSPYSVS